VAGETRLVAAQDSSDANAYPTIRPQVARERKLFSGNEWPNLHQTEH
jgi:hypothetical protein